MGEYVSACGRLPVSTDTDRYIIDWWICAFNHAATNGVCSATFYEYWNAVMDAVTASEGAAGYYSQGSTQRNGDYVDIYMYNRATGIEEHIGTFKWVCELLPKVPPCGNYGDVDGDGYVTENDVNLIIEYAISGWPVESPLTESEFVERADVNDDGVVNIGDATVVLNYLLGALTSFPVCGCTCNAWQNADCVSDTERRVVRTCVPPNCSEEEAIVADPSCGDVPPETSLVPLLVLGAAAVGVGIYLFSKRQGYK